MDDWANTTQHIIGWQTAQLFASRERYYAVQILHSFVHRGRQLPRHWFPEDWADSGQEGTPPDLAWRAVGD